MTELPVIPGSDPESIIQCLQTKLYNNRKKMQNSYIYIMTNKPNGTLYVGVTSDLIKRVYEHKNGFVEGFTKKYKTKKLAYFEVLDSIEDAIAREKQLKNWKREWKVALIEKENMEWKDLYDGLVEGGY